MKTLILDHPRIYSEAHFNDIANTPLWSCLMPGYLEAALKKNNESVAYLDATGPNWTFEKAREEILRLSPDLLCVHAVYFWEQTPALITFLSVLKTSGFHGHLNLFGFFPSLSYTTLLDRFIAIDSICVGECEETVPALAVALSIGEDWTKLNGLACRTAEGTVCFSPRPPNRNPDDFAPPIRRHAVRDTVSILASRGCYNHCRFCPIPAFYDRGPLWRGRHTECIEAEIKALVAEGTTDFYFADPNFIGPGNKGRTRALDLATRLHPLGITFGMETRAEDIDDPLMDTLTSAGLTSILIGIESGSNRILGDLEKHGSVAVSEQAIARCRRAGIEPEIGFLMFVPDATLEDLHENLDFLKRNRLLDRLDRTANLLCHRQIVFRGTSGARLFEALERVESADPLDFQLEIVWQDTRAKWVADIMCPVCLHVLKESSCPQSTVFWRNPDPEDSRQINDFLVSFFDKALAAARTHETPMPNPSIPLSEAKAFIDSLLQKKS